ncbi:hypothetical protein KEM48_001385 [Puccinia striiformis f. sp. tritici PST-130]|nr:hypothetical protein KEM48_001385 [Puccinia striiformis f. sp. tritici PST-130]
MLSRLPYHSHLNSQLPLAETLWHHQVAIVLAITTFSSVPTFRAPSHHHCFNLQIQHPPTPNLTRLACCIPSASHPTIDLQLDHHHTQQGSTTKG